MLFDLGWRAVQNANADIGNESASIEFEGDDAFISIDMNHFQTTSFQVNPDRAKAMIIVLEKYLSEIGYRQ